VTTNTPPETAHLPPDPTAYDSPRNAIARNKGLEAPYIVGGEDPDPATGLAEERKLLRWLLWMVAALVFGGFILGIIVAIVTGNISGDLI
jgi:hypothetical protein